MTLKEKILYHQIHPLKLSVDISVGIVTTILAWQHNAVWFWILFLLPSVIASLFIIKFANLDKLKNSAFGKYTTVYMTRTIETVRLSGQIIMWAAAWFHSPVFIEIGSFLIIAG